MLKKIGLAMITAATLVGLATPGDAGVTLNGIQSNALTGNALTGNALTGNALTGNALTGNALLPNGRESGFCLDADHRSGSVTAIEFPDGMRFVVR